MRLSTWYKALYHTANSRLRYKILSTIIKCFAFLLTCMYVCICIRPTYRYATISSSLYLSISFAWANCGKRYNLDPNQIAVGELALLLLNPWLSFHSRWPTWKGRGDNQVSRLDPAKPSLFLPCTYHSCNLLVAWKSDGIWGTRLRLATISETMGCSSSTALCSSLHQPEDRGQPHWSQSSVGHQRQKLAAS